MTSIQVENLSDVKKKITFEVPQDRVLEVVGAQYKDLKKNAQIKLRKNYTKGGLTICARRNLSLIMMSISVPSWAYFTGT